MSNNSLGKIFSVTSFGESHGPAVGCVIDGIPAGLLLDMQVIQHAVNLRKTNQTNYGSSRTEDDAVEIISGVYNNTTLGSPICIIIKNKDAHSADYDHLKNVYRPNHADFTTATKYGVRDHRGGGRTSIRITAPIVAAGVIALQLIQHYHAISIQSYVSSIGTVAMTKQLLQHTYEDVAIWQSAVRCPDATTSQAMLKHIDAIAAQKDTLGGCIYTTITNTPIGIGEPIFAKLQAQLAHAMLSINTVKAFAYGDGFDASTSTGSAQSDQFITTNNSVITATNHSGGIQGGISNGMPITFTTAFKPISSIQQPQQTIDANGQATTITINGRHDVCAVTRAVPIVNAYTAIVLADLILQHKLSKL
jgi:chorismate synthase